MKAPFQERMLIMFKKQDPYSFTQYVLLYGVINGTQEAIGTLATEYRVALYNDVLG
ncbi:hypothetical protein S2091_4233 [Solimicrobium silvestre]|uniref:Uncharacterized protein n=1 Tax=Solimicrobium silvestre TaxID=2099400 RepID=A0A2S9GTK7_9BURK|nr:hypothetical protein S2091_4233 [Solimicrobium silvestre]